jgi:predicted dehydrogenase
VRVAVVGCGAIAEAYHLPALAGHKELLDSAVLVDPDLTRAYALATRFRVKRVASAVEPIMRDIDAAIVATPPWLHARVTMPLLARGIHVLCEKPLAESALDANRMIEHQGAHVFDTICWWLGGKPTVVSCSTDSFGGPEGSVSVVLRHHACTISIKLSWLSKLSNTYRIVGTRGVIEGATSDWRRVTVGRTGGRPRQVKVSADRDDYLAFGRVVIDNFLSAIRGGAAPLAPAASVLPSLQLIDECYRCASRMEMPWVQAAAEPGMKATLGS